MNEIVDRLWLKTPKEHLMKTYNIDLNDPGAVTPIGIALNPALADVLDAIAAKGWPEVTIGTPV